MIIGVTDTMSAGTKFRLYEEWLRAGDPSIHCRRLSCLDSAHPDLGASDALVLTGGGDVDPELYGGDASHPSLSGVNRRRDDFERSAIDAAVQRGIPLLGICRGLQIANVHFGGTLVPDLAERGLNGHDSEGHLGSSHPVGVSPGSLLSEISGAASGTVNSFHHQAADAPGAGLCVAARAADGVIEALEPENPGGRPFFLLVQWHPERMHDAGNVFNKNLRERFIKSIKGRP